MATPDQQINRLSGLISEVDPLQESRRWYDRAGGIAGRSLTRSKAPGALFMVGDGPLYALDGAGAELIDVDGNRYIDMICALGAISLGYGRIKQQSTGGVYSLPHRVEIQASESALTQLAPWATSVRFVKTGSEALQAAVMIARKATGRHRVLVADTAYHGWHAWAVNREFSGLPGVIDQTIQYRYGESLHDCASDIAAVIIEPARWQRTNREYFGQLKDTAHEIGALFIIDEMIYGGRWALGGATDFYGVIPDLACYGKAFGNGAAIACVVGRDALATHGEMISGTYSGDVHGLSAFVDVLDIYKREPVIQTLWQRGRQLRRGLDDIIKSSSGGLSVVREGEDVHQRLRFSNPAHGKRFAAEMAARHVLWHPEVINVCAAHMPAQIETVLAAAEASIEILEAES